MDVWTNGDCGSLPVDMEAEAKLWGDFTREKSEDQLHQAFNTQVLNGKLQLAARQLTNRANGGGVLSPNVTDEKSGKTVLSVLQQKHPAPREPSNLGTNGRAFEFCRSVLSGVPTTISSDIVKEEASKLRGAAGPDGLEARCLQAWLSGFGTVSVTLRGKMAAVGTWLTTSAPPWASHQALIACQLVASDEQPGVRPVGIGNSICRSLAKCLLNG